jgi:DDE superfamily endonuclease
MVSMFFERGESLMRPELHGTMRLRADDGWHDGVMAATSCRLKGGRMTGRLLWLATTSAGDSLRVSQHEGSPPGLSLPYDEIVDFTLRPSPFLALGSGGELRITTRSSSGSLRFQGARTFATELFQLLPFVVMWRARGIRPWEVDTFKLFTDPDLEAKLVDVVGLYVDPPERAVVLCVDENSRAHALERTQPSLALTPRRGSTVTHDYRRHGTTTNKAALAARVRMSASSVGRIWRAFRLRPWATDTFKLSEGPQFIEKIRDAVGLDLNPRERALVLCVDDKSGIQALDRTQPIMPMRPGQVKRSTHEYYLGNGIVDRFAARNLATGWVLHDIRSQYRTTQRRAVELRRFLDAIDAAVPGDLDVYVVLDNSSNHNTPEINEWLRHHPRFRFHVTPTSSSWLDLVERWFAELTNQMLPRSAHRTIRTLTHDLNAWIATRNDNPQPFVWHKTADEILENSRNT